MMVPSKIYLAAYGGYIELPVYHSADLNPRGLLPENHLVILTDLPMGLREILPGPMFFWLIQHADRLGAAFGREVGARQGTLFYTNDHGGLCQDLGLQSFPLPLIPPTEEMQVTQPIREFEFLNIMSAFGWAYCCAPPLHIPPTTNPSEQEISRLPEKPRSASPRRALSPSELPAIEIPQVLVRQPYANILDQSVGARAHCLSTYLREHPFWQRFCNDTVNYRFASKKNCNEFADALAHLGLVEQQDFFKVDGFKTINRQYSGPSPQTVEKIFYRRSCFLRLKPKDDRRLG